MRIIFMGTPDFSVPILNEIVALGHEVVAVYSQPARAKGRGLKFVPTPVAERATQMGLQVHTPLNFKNDEDIALFQSHDADVAIVVAYGLILPQVILDAPRFGALNVHASLLPRWRGAAPLQRAIMAGDAESGVMIMQMEAGLDTGPIGLVDQVDISPDMTAQDLHDILSHRGADLINRALPALERGSLVFAPQSDQGVSYAHKIEKHEAKIDWGRTCVEVRNHIHGLSPFPGAWFEYQDKGKAVRVKVLRGSVIASGAKAAPGTVLRADGDHFHIACEDGVIALTQVQKAGKGAMAARDFLHGSSLRAGDVL